MQKLNNIQIEIRITEAIESDNDGEYRFQPELKEAIQLLKNEGYTDIPPALDQYQPDRKNQEFTDYLEITLGGLNLGIIQYDEHENLVDESEEGSDVFDDDYERHRVLFDQIKNLFDPGELSWLRESWDNLWAVRIYRDCVVFTVDSI